MSLFKGIVKLTEEQYLTLKNGGTITNDLGTFAFDENVLYVTDRDYTQMKTKIVESLPEVGEVNTIYMVLKEGSSTDYNRYMYINDRYTIIGETTIDLAGYAKLDDIPTSLPASDVYDWAKQPTKPSYSVSELPSEILTTTRSEIGGNSVTAKQSFSVVRNTNGTVNQGILSINDNGAARLSHRNKSVNSNADDSYIDLDSNGVRINGEEVAVKDEVYEFAKVEHQKESSSITYKDLTRVIANTSSQMTETDDYIRVVSTGNYAYVVYSLSNLKVGQIYTFGFNAKCLDTSTRPRVFLGSSTSVSDGSYKTTSLENNFDTRYSHTFTATSNILGITLYVNTTTIIEGNFMELSEISLVEGDKDIAPAGKIVRTKDMNQIFLNEQYNKSLNLIDGTLMGGDMWDIQFGYTNKLKPNTTYTFHSITSGVGGSNVSIRDKYTNETIQLLNSAWEYHPSSFTFTTSADIIDGNDYYFNFSGTHDNASIVEAMLNEGKSLPYQPYNQASHITNAQADLLNNEFEKSKNILPNTSTTTTVNGIAFTVNSDKSIKITGTSAGKATIGLHVEDILLEKGQYNLSFTSSGFGWMTIGTQIGSSYYSTSTSTTITLNENQTFKKWYIDIESGQTVDITVYPMFVKGNNVLSYQQYNGEIIHKKDITPALLWENASPNSNFASQTINLSKSLNDYKKLIIVYKEKVDDYILPSIATFDISNNSAGKVCNIFHFVTTNEPYTDYKSREFVITVPMTGIQFIGGFKNTISNNSVMIPIKIYATNY